MLLKSSASQEKPRLQTLTALMTGARVPTRRGWSEGLQRGKVTRRGTGQPE